MIFSPLDWIVLGVYLVSMVAIGFRFSGKQTSAKEFFLGGQRFGSVATSISVLATAVSAITFLGLPGFVVQKDWSLLVSSLIQIPAAILVAILFIPFFWKLKLTSAYEYLDKRFALSVSITCSVLFLLMRGLLAGIAIYAPSLALAAVTGWSMVGCIIISGIVTIFYTTLGGMSAVIWTDIVQAIVLFGGAVLIAFLLAGQISGDIGDWTSRIAAAQKFNILNFDWSFTSLTFWNSTIGGMAYAVAFFGVDQVLVQRYLASSSLAKAKKSLYLNAIYLTPVTLIFYVIGTLLYLFMREHADAFPKDLPADQIMAYYIVKYLPTGLPGLMVAAIYAAAMSTVSSVLNSLATVCVNDFYKRVKPAETEAHYVSLGRKLTIGWGVLAILTALLSIKFAKSSVALATIQVGGLFAGPMLGVFLLGMFSVRASAVPALIGLAVGIITSGVVVYGKVVPDINQQAAIKDGWVTLVTDLKRGERVKLIDAKDEASIHEVLEVVEGKFRTDFKPEGDKVFVYGRKVKLLEEFWLSALGTGVTWVVGWLLALFWPVANSRQNEIKALTVFGRRESGD